jgi:hypothetical protein
VPLAHTCNPSYSGGRDQEDRSSKPAQANSSQDPISTHHKKGWTVAQREGPEFKPQYWKKKKEKKSFTLFNVYFFSPPYFYPLT